MPADFDGVARIYRALEYVAFGRTLEAARFQYLDRLRDCREILVLGEGDGRCLEALLRSAPNASVHCVDASAEMLALAQRRVPAAAAARVRFDRADVTTLQLQPGAYDAVVTMFFLDCFTASAARDLIARVTSAMRPDARWLFADFAIPPSGWARRHARLIVGGLYWFFRWRTGIAANALPPSEVLLHQTGWLLADLWEARGGLVRSAVFQLGRSAGVVEQRSTDR